MCAYTPGRLAASCAHTLRERLHRWQQLTHPTAALLRMLEQGAKVEWDKGGVETRGGRRGGRRTRRTHTIAGGVRGHVGLEDELLTGFEQRSGQTVSEEEQKAID